MDEVDGRPRDGFVMAGDKYLHRSSQDSTNGDRRLVSIGRDNTDMVYTGLDIVSLEPHTVYELETGADEIAIVPLQGSVNVLTKDSHFCLDGRPDVFSSTTDFAYVGTGEAVRLESEGGGEYAVARARTSEQRPPVYGPRDVTRVTVRGAGACTRQVNDMITPDTFDASKLFVVEVLSPAGNWSSYPPHKHDEERPPEEVELEEIYYFRTRQPSGFGIHHLYSQDGSLDITRKIGNGDVFLIPHGYHGPTIAGPGYDLYYLNVLAGPSNQRSMTPHFDPIHASIRDQWETEEPDPRVPFYE